MDKFTTPTLKRVRCYDLLTVGKYIKIRYQVFVMELARSIVEEFSLDDLIAEHYLLAGSENIGIVRVIYRRDNIAEIGRLAILKEYRNQGYATLLVKQIIETVRAKARVNIARLFTEEDKIAFYKKLGFATEGVVLIDGEPFMSMINVINR